MTQKEIDNLPDGTIVWRSYEVYPIDDPKRYYHLDDENLRINYKQALKLHVRSIPGNNSIRHYKYVIDRVNGKPLDTI